MNKTLRLIILILNDIVLCVFTIIFALIIRSDAWPLWEAWSKPAVIAIILHLFIFTILKFQNNFFKYFNSKSLDNYFIGFFFYSILFISLLFFFHFPKTPRSIGAIQPILFYTLLIFSRYIAKLYLEKKNIKTLENTLIIVGHADSIDSIYKLLNNFGANFSTHYLFSRNKDQIGRSIMGRKILSIDKLEDILNFNPEGLLIVENGSVENIKEHWKNLLKSNLRFLQFKNDDGMNILCPIDYHSVIFEETEFKINDEFYENKCILISGAGGSVGSQIAKQLSFVKDTQLILIDNNELNLFNIKKNFESSSAKNISFHLLSVLDNDKLNNLFNSKKIDIVIHAAAYKHVNLLQDQPLTAIENNYLATKILYDFSKKYFVSNFLLISTDKAVRPTSLMGVSKRLAELYCLSEKNEKTNLSIVRFGNVINSSGSVLTIFVDQILKNKPITVTHKKVNRYFMSIEQASKLVLQANTFGKYSIYHLDMGEPQNIYELAKSLIKLHGYTPVNSSLEKVGGHERLIHITGLKKGEKLYEELLVDKKNKIMKHKNIFAFNENIDQVGAKSLLKKVEIYINKEDKNLLKDIVSDQLINYEVINYKK
jgi:UDP-N-acetyl-D-glucosamine 4,6-dehydratase